MAPKVAWAVLADTLSPGLAPDAAYRWRRRRSRLAHDDEPEQLLASWVASRAERRLFQARRPDGVLTDERVVLSGLSDRRAGIAAGGFVEGYVLSRDLSALRREHLLRPASHRPDVVLHVVDVLPPSPVPLLVLAADLAEHDQPRELARARELIVEALA
ncbi:MAG: hypothetical protein FWH11_10200 [Micrococcales bacterium]|nr:hypothetical protein [Micrococcales bacterium]